MKRARVFRTVVAATALALAVLLAGCSKKTIKEEEGVTAPPQELGMTVIITPAGIPNAAHYTVKLSKGMKPNQDHMRWRNESGQKVTLHFKSGWPFQGSGTTGPGSVDIVLEAGASSAWYTISPTAVDGAVYDYGLDPNLIGTPGPTDPSVSSEP